MPSPYAADVPRLKAEIVARLDAGEHLNAICASPAMPGVGAVRAWAKADPVFGEALAAAKRRGTWRRLWTVDEAKAEAFLARARAGEPIRALLGRPGMPSQTAYRRWKIAHAPFAEAAFALLQRRDAHTRQLGLARRRAFDQAAADRIVARLREGSGLKALLKADPDLPSFEVVARWRREQPEFDRALRIAIAMRRRAGRPVPEALREDVVDHIVRGGTFRSYSDQPGAPSFNTLRIWMRDPDFARAVAQACEWREEWFADQVLVASETTSAEPLEERARRVTQLKRQVARLRHRPHKPLWPTPKRKAPAERPAWTVTAQVINDAKVVSK